MKSKQKNQTKLKRQGYTMGIGAVAKGSGNVMGLGVLTLTDMKGPGKLGSSVKPSQLTGTETAIIFTTPESIIEMINDLAKMLPGMRDYKKELKRATKNLSDRHPNKLGPISRSGKK